MREFPVFIYIFERVLTFHEAITQGNMVFKKYLKIPGKILIILHDKQESKENFQKVKTMKILRLQKSNKVKANNHSGAPANPWWLLDSLVLIGLKWVKKTKCRTYSRWEIWPKLPHKAGTSKKDSYNPNEAPKREEPDRFSLQRETTLWRRSYNAYSFNIFQSNLLSYRFEARIYTTPIAHPPKLKLTI